MNDAGQSNTDDSADSSAPLAFCAAVDNAQAGENGSCLLTKSLIDLVNSLKFYLTNISIKIHTFYHTTHTPVAMTQFHIHLIDSRGKYNK